MNAQTVTWWISVSTHDTWGSELYAREVEMAFLPNEGDHVYVMLTDDPEDTDEGSVAYNVYRRHFDVHGRAHLTFQQIVIDPQPPLDNNLPRGYTSWFMNQEKTDPVAMLRRTGWVVYHEYLESR